MVDDEREKNADGVVRIGLKSKAVGNGLLAEIENDGVDGYSTGSSMDCVKTYKRRKHTRTSSSETKSFEDGKVSTYSASYLTSKTLESLADVRFRSTSSNQASLARNDFHASAKDSDDSSLKDWRKIVLEQMHQSLNESEGGLQDCIRDALVFYQEGDCTTTMKESVHFCEEMHREPSQTGLTLNDIQNPSKRVKLNGSTNESADSTNTDLCKHALFDILVSKTFADLCELLFGNFQGMKVDCIFDFSLINSRIKEGAYEISPMQFQSDLQQVWSKLQKIGTEMFALAKSLSENSRTSYHDEVAGSVRCITDDGLIPSLVQEPDGHAIREQTDYCQYGVCSCRHCGEKTEGSDFLVCDSCEEMYHVSCIEPTAQEIHLNTWYCTKCTAKGIASPHENCVVCQRINVPRAPVNGIGSFLTNGEEVELEESSDDLEDDELLSEGETLPYCCICNSMVENDEKFRVCGHSFCPHKYYHERCLTIMQLNLYGPLWYCPSCLCRGCLTDRDDDKIVLCDGCDQAFHIYCMQPPLLSIPRGKWFCQKCDVGIKRIRKAKNAYVSMQYKLRKTAEGGKGAYKNFKDVQKEIDNSGGVDMLLTAAKTLNYEENLAAMGLK